jgi:hypothetical protein
MKLLTTALLILVLTCRISAQTQRKVAVLDMQTYNPLNSNSSKQSAFRAMRAIGVPYEITSDLSIAIQYPVILTGSRVEENSLSTSQRNLLKAYIQQGGVLITSCLRDTALFDLCGISNKTTSNTLFKIELDTTAAPIFDYVDDTVELTLSIGNAAIGTTFYTQKYTLDQAIALAHYEDGSVAIAKSNFGQGKVYLFGPDFKDIIFRNQVNFDSKAERIYSNGFEPTTDIFFFLIRNIIRQHIPHSIYKYTIPRNSTSTLMITHDIDSRTAIDTMKFFSSFEKSRGVKAMYNITTRYFHDALMSNFYINSWPEVNQLKADGHIISSHSVGHFPDFDNETIFPLGTLGNTVSNYSPAYHTGITSGGTVLGELEVSKSLLENDHGVVVKSFRAGYLAYNDSLIMGLENLGYEYNSTFSANDVLTSFPYYGIRVRSFNAVESNVLEIPMTISDVFTDISDSNYMDKVSIWSNATLKYNANHSPVVLLIHPNRQYKLSAENAYLNQIPTSIALQSMEDYGIFWKMRDSLQYHTELRNDTLIVRMDNNYLAKEQSFVLDFSGLDTVLFIDYVGNKLSFQWQNWDYGTRLYYQTQISDLGVEDLTLDAAEKKVLIYPNPSMGTINVVLTKTSMNNEYSVFNFLGEEITKGNWSGISTKIDLTNRNLKSGVYFIQMKCDGDVFREKFVIQKN